MSIKTNYQSVTDAVNANHFVMMGLLGSVFGVGIGAYRGMNFYHHEMRRYHAPNSYMSQEPNAMDVVFPMMMGGFTGFVAGVYYPLTLFGMTVAGITHLRH